MVLFIGVCAFLIPKFQRIWRSQTIIDRRLISIPPLQVKDNVYIGECLMVNYNHYIYTGHPLVPCINKPQMYHFKMVGRGDVRIWDWRGNFSMINAIVLETRFNHCSRISLRISSTTRTVFSSCSTIRTFLSGSNAPPCQYANMKEERSAVPAIP